MDWRQFLAYYGIMTRNTSLLDAAYEQCRLYRQYLLAPSMGLWRHIVLGDSPDPGLWSTGKLTCGPARVSFVPSEHDFGLSRKRLGRERNVESRRRAPKLGFQRSILERDRGSHIVDTRNRRRRMATTSRA